MARILVVDDEPDIRLLVRYSLASDHHDVIEAADGREALDAVTRQRPDLVVLDVMMPELSGWDVLGHLKADVQLEVREIPVVMLTALSEPMDRARGGIEGAVSYLAKPIAPDELRETVAAALAGDPEPVQRRRAQQRALQEVARMERGDAGAEPPSTVPQPRLTNLEGTRPTELHRSAKPPSVTAPSSSSTGAGRAAERSGPPTSSELRRLAAELTPRQQDLLRALQRQPTVRAAADDLGMSRSNIYASLRRIARRLEIDAVGELLDHVRSGRVLD